MSKTFPVNITHKPTYCITQSFLNKKFCISTCSGIGGCGSDSQSSPPWKRLVWNGGCRYSKVFQVLNGISIPV